MNAGNRRQALGLLVVLGVVVAASVFSSPERTIEAIEDLLANPFQFALALTLLYLVRPLVAWPLSLLSVLVGYAYGLALGFPVALAGALVSCLVPFLLARYLRSDVGLVGYLSGSGRRFFDATGNVRGVFAARLAPAPADAISYGAGLSGIPTGAFVLGTVLGEIPWTAAFVLVGTSMSEFSSQEATLDSTAFVLGATALAVLVLAGPTYRYVQARWAGGSVSDGTRGER